MILIGEDDEAIDPGSLRAVFIRHAPHSQMIVLPHINHFGIFTNLIALEKITGWLTARSGPSPTGCSAPNRFE